MRGSMRWTSRWTASRASPPSPAWVRWWRRFAASRATPGSTPRMCGRSPTIGRWCARSTPRSRPTCGRRPPRSTCTRCRAGSSRTCASRRARWASPNAGTRWPEAYAEINRMFGDIVKVTPTSKVVGDMALVMVSGGLTRADVEDPDREIAFPDSVVGLFRGELGRMPGGFPEPLASKILKGEKPIEERPRCHPSARRPRGRARAGGGGDRLVALGRGRLFLALLSQGVRGLRGRGTTCTGRCLPCRPTCSSTGSRPGATSRSRSSAGTRWSSAAWPWERPTRRARCASSSS